MSNKIIVTHEDTNYRVRTAYLVRFVKPNEFYPVSYTIAQDGTKTKAPTFLQGKDLTEPQIVELFAKEQL